MWIDLFLAFHSTVEKFYHEHACLSIEKIGKGVIQKTGAEKEIGIFFHCMSEECQSKVESCWLFVQATKFVS